MSGSKPCGVCKIVGVLVAIGALNWGSIGLFQVDLVGKFLGAMTTASRAVYTIIGIAGVLKVLWLLGVCPCTKGSCEPKK